MLLHPPLHQPRIQRLSRKRHHPHLQPTPLLPPFHHLHQLPERRRRLAQHRHPLPLQHLIHSLWPPRLLPLQYHQLPPVQPCSPHLPHRYIERIGVKQRPHIPPAELEPSLRRREQPHHVPVRHHHPLRLPRRTRSVDHIRRVSPLY